MLGINLSLHNVALAAFLPLMPLQVAVSGKIHHHYESCAQGVFSESTKIPTVVAQTRRPGEPDMDSCCRMSGGSCCV